MAIAKVVLNGTTQIDLTQDTVQASNTASGATGHKNDGTAFTDSIATKSDSDITVSGATITRNTRRLGNLYHRRTRCKYLKELEAEI